MTTDAPKKAKPLFCAHCRRFAPRPDRVLCATCAQKQHDYKEAKIAAGFCRHCNKPREKERRDRNDCVACAAAHRAKARARRPLVADRINARQRARYWDDPQKNNEQSRVWREGARRRVYEAYGGAACVCCGETEEAFLTLDHINNDGNKARKKYGAGQRTGASTYLWAIKNDFPPGLQVLCYNCNSGRYRNGGNCPHQEEAINAKAS